MKKLSIAKGLDLPPDAVTQRMACLGRTGSGKTYAGKRIVEQMLRIGAQAVILDGAGVWAGLRLGPKSFDIPVLGGLYGDIPLEPTAGALIADLIVDSGTSMVLDVSQMLDAERTRFATAFAQRFFQRKKASRGAVHLVLEECQDFVPQNPQKGEERMLHEFQRIAKQGRAFGIGITLISQRPQEISKKVLNQTECVFAFQMTGAHERKALEYWLGDKGLEEKLSDVLPKLEVGAPHVWSPQWLKISRVVKILPIETLDTSSTPEVGQKKAAQKKLKPIDLKGLSAAMKETIERAKADDPRELRAALAAAQKKIAELEKGLGQTKQAKEPKPVPVDWKWLRKETEAATGAFIATLEGAMAALEKRISNATCDSEVVHNGKGRPGRVASTQFDGSSLPAPKPRVLPPKSKGAPHTIAVSASGSSTFHFTEADRLPKGQRAVLIAAVQHPNGVTREQITILTGFKRSTRDAYVYRLCTAGLLESDGSSSDPRLHATDAGRAAVPDYEPLPTGRDLLEYWYEHLPSGERTVLAFVASAYPDAATRQEIEESTGFKRSTRDAYIYRLSVRKLVSLDSGNVALAEELT